ncbi:uncharacterized protein TNCV_3112641 [Trichonephila clavipes]|nr:uncharacterized protein TNCV_3112641 [Trichonephila clavipes]
MNFLRKEVQGEEMVQLARTGFGPEHNFRKNNAPVECVIQSELTTASALVSLDSGANVMGRLLTGNVVTLHSGLTAVESKLGWKLEVLGITDPTETVKEREDLSEFREKIKILPKGRYEVQPPRKKIAQKMKRSLYVDNLDTSELEHFIEQAKCNMNKGFFNLRGFESNVDCKNVGKHSGDTLVLGIIWNLDNDVLKCCVDLEPLTCEVRIAKRLILSVAQKTFDSIGLLTPTTLLPKLLLQNLWKLKISWDYELPPNCKKEFLAWFKDTSVLKNVNICCMRLCSINNRF